MTNPLPEGSPGAAPVEELRKLAEFMRTTLAHVLTASELPPIPTGTCALASILLRDAVNRFTPHKAAIRGGAGELSEGALAVTGQWHGHYWVEVRVHGSEESVILDLTADQFGWAEVICEPLSALGHRYRAGDQAGVDEHMEWTLSWLTEHGQP